MPSHTLSKMISDFVSVGSSFIKERETSLFTLLSKASDTRLFRLSYGVAKRSTATLFISSLREKLTCPVGRCSETPRCAFENETFLCIGQIGEVLNVTLGEMLINGIVDIGRQCIPFLRSTVRREGRDESIGLTRVLRTFSRLSTNQGGKLDMFFSSIVVRQIEVAMEENDDIDVVFHLPLPGDRQEQQKRDGHSSTKECERRATSIQRETRMTCTVD